MRPFVVLLLASCSSPEPAPPAVAAAIETAPPAPEPEPAPLPAKVWDTTLDHSAKVFAGLAVPDDSKFYPITQTPGWKRYQQEIDAVWTKYGDTQLTDIRTWSSSDLGHLPPKTVLYPFSGPDILNVVSFFPQGKSYILFGLEPVGEIPHLEGVPNEKMLEDGRDILAALGTVLGTNFFVTLEMREEVGQGFDGVGGIMIWFLARTGHDILDARKVALDADGQVIADAEGSANAPHGVEITFRTTGLSTDDAVRTAYYFPGDISDGALAGKPAIKQFVLAQGEMYTFLKAASYLMFKPKYDDIRSTILARSAAIVTDDSGLPFHYVDNAGWETKLYGTYTAPIDIFTAKCQPDLEDALAERSLGKLPFSVGYTHRTPHMVVAFRAASNPLSEPALDGDAGKGDTTSCSGGKLNVTRN